MPTLPRVRAVRAPPRLGEPHDDLHPRRRRLGSPIQVDLHCGWTRRGACGQPCFVDDRRPRFRPTLAGKRDPAYRSKSKRWTLSGLRAAEIRRISHFADCHRITSCPIIRRNFGCALSPPEEETCGRFFSWFLRPPSGSCSSAAPVVAARPLRKLRRRRRLPSPLRPPPPPIRRRPPPLRPTARLLPLPWTAPLPRPPPMAPLPPPLRRMARLPPPVGLLPRLPRLTDPYRN